MMKKIVAVIFLELFEFSHLGALHNLVKKFQVIIETEVESIFYKESEEMPETFECKTTDNIEKHINL